MKNLNFYFIISSQAETSHLTGFTLSCYMLLSLDSVVPELRNKSYLLFSFQLATSADTTRWQFKHPHLCTTGFCYKSFPDMVQITKNVLSTYVDARL